MSGKHFEGIGDGRHIVNIDEDSPDVLLARSEPLHEDEQEDYDADLLPEDTGATIDFSKLRGVPKDALKVLLRFLIPATSSTRARRFRIAQIRVVLLARLCDLDDLKSVSLEALATDLKCTRALLSLRSVTMADGLGLNKTSLGKSRDAREAYRQSAIRAHRERVAQVGKFVAARLARRPGTCIALQSAHAAYVEWCKFQGAKPLVTSDKKLLGELKRIGFQTRAGAGNITLLVDSTIIPMPSGSWMRMRRSS